MLPVKAGLVLERTMHSDARLRETMPRHYSAPKGFVGRSICYAVLYGGVYFGHTVAGSATRFLPNRDQELGITKQQLNNVVNNTYFHIEGEYPVRNFAAKVTREWRKRVVADWPEKYGDTVLGFETLVELPRTGLCYRQDGWRQIGQTKGYTCKRTAGQGTDSWSGKRVWDTENLRPKLVFVRNIT